MSNTLNMIMPCKLVVDLYSKVLNWCDYLDAADQKLQGQLTPADTCAVVTILCVPQQISVNTQFFLLFYIYKRCLCTVCVVASITLHMNDGMIIIK